MIVLGRDLLIFATAAILLAGCAVGPDYHEPKAPIPGNWSESAESVSANRPAELAQWWKTFQDPMLDSLVGRAVAANYDLRIAEARLCQSRAQREFVLADFWPRGNASASYSHQRTSQNITISSLASGFTGSPGAPGAPGASGAAGAAADPPGDPPSSAFPAGFPFESNLYQAGFDASWELDVFGGKRRALEAATDDLAASAENRNDVLVSLLAEVARNYVQLRGLQYRLQIARDTIHSQRETLEITQQRYQGSLASDLDVAQETALLAGTESQLPPLESSIRQTMHQLSLLLGQTPGALAGELSPEAPLPSTPPQVPVGLPSQLLRRRPDVRRAERQLASATAEIGVQVAELFPKFSLTGDVGLESAEPSNWFTSGSRYFSFGPTVTWRIFDFCRIQANIRAQNAKQEEALATYEKTVLTALQEVEDALVAYDKERRRFQSLRQQVQSDETALQIATERYIQGLSGFLNVLVLQRALYQGQDQLAQSKSAVCEDLIALYKALGGGWTALECPSGMASAETQP